MFNIIYYRKLFFVSILLILAGCGAESEVQKVVKKNLLDPESVRFGDFVLSNNEERACIVWNAKNRMGGYGGDEVAEMVRLGEDWTVKTMKGRAYNCTQASFELFDVEERSDLESRRYFSSKLKKVLDLSRAEYQDITGYNAACSDLSYGYVRTKVNVDKLTYRKEKLGQDFFEKEFEEAVRDFEYYNSFLDAGDCQSAKEYSACKSYDGWDYCDKFKS